jgi:hypothetical protein
MPSGLILTREKWIDEFLEAHEATDNGQDADDLVNGIMSELNL